MASVVRHFWGSFARTSILCSWIPTYFFWNCAVRFWYSFPVGSIMEKLAERNGCLIFHRRSRVFAQFPENEDRTDARHAVFCTIVYHAIFRTIHPRLSYGRNEHFIPLEILAARLHFVRYIHIMGEKEVVDTKRRCPKSVHIEFALWTLFFAPKAFSFCLVDM